MIAEQSRLYSYLYHYKKEGAHMSEERDELEVRQHHPFQRNKGMLVVISGFSGSGKGPLMKQLVENYD